MAVFNPALTIVPIIFPIPMPDDKSPITVDADVRNSPLPFANTCFRPNNFPSNEKGEYSTPVSPEMVFATIGFVYFDNE